MKLNEANLAVWYELLKNEEMKDIVHKILINSALPTEDGKVTKEMKELLKKEKVAILEAKEIVENNNNISKRISEYIEELKLEGNDTLKGIFSNRAITEFMSGELTSIHDVDSIYKQVRIEYLTIDTHKKIKDEYKSSIKLDLVECIESKFNEGINDKKEEENKKVVVPNITTLTPQHPTAIYSEPIITPEMKNLFSSIFGKSFDEDSKVKFKFINLDELSGNSKPPNGIPDITKLSDLDNLNKTHISSNIVENKEESTSFNDAVNQMIFAELEAIHNEVFNKPLTSDELEIAHDEALEEGWYDDDPKESIRTLLVYIKRLEHQMGL